MRIQLEGGFTIETMADGTLPISTWPGVYPLIYITADAGTLCGACANGQNGSIASVVADDNQWLIVGQQVLWENEDGRLCDNCQKPLECAYPLDDAPTHVRVTLTDTGKGLDYSVNDNGIVTAAEILHPMGGRNANLVVESHGSLAGGITLPVKDAKYMVARLLQVEVEDLPTMPGTSQECRILR